MIASPTRAKVLVIDDEIGPRLSVRFTLSDQYEVICADCVDQGIQFAKEHHPDLIILDIRMPGKNGIEGLRELRALDKDCSIVMLTGFGALETAQQALRLGANDYLNKPFDTNEMRRIADHYTKRTRNERRRLHMLQELQDMNKRMMEDLADKDSMAQLGRASAEFAHDLRNPLMIVTGYVQLLSRELERAKELLTNESSQAPGYLSIIETNVRRCGELAHEWQKMGKGDLSAFELHKASTLVDDLRVCVEPLACTIGVTVEFEGDPGDALFMGSRAQMIRALYNVVANAIDAVQPGEGRVKVKISRQGCTLLFVVEDNGTGMTPEVLEHVFEPYFTTKSKDKGTGLGTVITRRIVEEHGGSVSIESELGKGTLFSILLPVATPKPAETPAA